LEPKYTRLEEQVEYKLAVVGWANNQIIKELVVKLDFVTVVMLSLIAMKLVFVVSQPSFAYI
jgi:hypothetical protein